jgi:hypothetical protein
VTSIPRLAIGLMAKHGAPPLPIYERALKRACRAAPPPYGQAEYGDLYREAATDATWLAVSLVTNAEREGDGATRLWSLAACTEDAGHAAELKQHAIDESNHSKMYLRLADLVFPDAIAPEFRMQLRTLSPGYTRTMEPVAVQGSPFSHALSLDDLIQMNIAEIRTTVHHLLQRPMLLEHCPHGRRGIVLRLLDTLLRDEVAHVAYTAKLIERHVTHSGSDAVLRLFAERLKDFNDVTRAELQRQVFDVS